MLKRMVALAILLMMLTMCVVPAYADSFDTLDDLAASFVDAIRSGKTAFQFYTTDYNDINHMIGDLFVRYPALMHYLGSGESIMYPDHMEGTIYLQNTQDSLDDIWVIGSDEELLAALGMGLLEARTEIRFVTRDDYLLTEEKIDNAIEVLHYQYPVAYMGYDSRGIGWVGSENYDVKDYTVTFRYHYDLDAATLQQWRAETEQVVLYLLENVVAQDMPDYQKVLRIHDWIINNTRYNTVNLDEEGNHLAYGALVKGSCVCMGYAEAGVIMFQAAGIDTYYISGEGTNSAGETESHAWNAVKVDGAWYLVDMTWDDPVSADNQDILRYDYFLLTDSELARDHVWDRTGLPVCNGGQWNADLALHAYEQDNGIYSMYDTFRYMPLKQVRDLFASRLTTGTESYEALQFEQEPVLDWTDTRETEPEEYSQPQPQPQPQPQIPVPPAQEKEAFPWGIVIIALGVVIVAGVVIGAVAQAKARRRRYRRPVDPNRFASAGHVNFD